jgi:hypothetical protein
MESKLKSSSRQSKVMKSPGQERKLAARSVAWNPFRSFAHALVAFTLGVAPVLNAADLDLSQLPPPSTKQVDFDQDIRPIFEKSCLRCHGPERPKSRFRLDARDAALKGGEHGVAIVAGDSAKSPLIHYVARLVEDMEMPPAGKGEPLSKDQIGLLRAWIDQGVKWSASPESAKLTFSISPTVRWVTVHGDRNQFREHAWMDDRWSAGFEEFRYQQKFGPDTTVTMEGRAYFGGDQYRVRLSADKRDLGFARFGFEQYRHYYDDTGGYYAPFATNSFDLNHTLALDVGRAWLDLGLTIPDWPRVTLGYEYQYKEGTKSSLVWSDVFDRTGNTQAIYPAFKEIDERVHTAKFDLSHEINGVLIEDNFRGELYDLETRRVNRASVRLGRAVPDNAIGVSEEYDHFQAVNAFRLEKQLRDWLFLSGGYLFSKLDGDAAFSVAGFVPSDPSVTLFQGDASQQVLLERRSHLLNFNTALGPWNGLIVLAGVQNDWTKEKGFGDALAPNFPDPNPRIFAANRDRLTIEENFGFRYTAIPATVLYGESRFQQEGIDHFERQVIDDDSDSDQDFLRDTDATSNLQDYRAGLSISPWRRVSLHSSYRHRFKQNNYDHRIDLDSSAASGNGYPAFIHSRDIETDEIEAKLVLHWISWLKTSLKYQLLATDYTTATDPSSVTVFDPVTFLPVDVSLPGGETLAGNHDAHVYSLNATLTPWKRWYLSTTLSYTDSRTATAVNDGVTVADYKGDVCSALASSNFIINDSTDWHTTYSFSRADYERRNGFFPTGIAYDRHGLVTGLTKRFKKNLTTRLEYGLFRYDEPSSGGINNYTAHAILGTVSLVLR